MKFYFLHNHYIPFEVKNGPIKVESVIVPEFYSNLNKLYIGEDCGFDSVEMYIDHVIKCGYYEPETSFSVENIRIINSKNIRETLFKYKRIGVKIIQLYSGRDNEYYGKEKGLTAAGEKLLLEVYDAGLILDLSHLPDDAALVIAEKFGGRIIVSHCACTDLYAQQKPRSNSLSRSTIYKLAKRVEVFGISFVNDIISSAEYETNSYQIYKDFITQMHLFVDTVGATKVALGPDYYDTAYFSKLFHLELTYPDNFLSQRGLIRFVEEISQDLSTIDTNNILCDNVIRLFKHE